MSYKVIAVPEFSKQIKKLAKKYHSLKAELADLIDALQENPTLDIALAKDVFKIRLAIASKGKGKRGGARVITYVHVNDETILLLSIYNKGKNDNIIDKELQRF